MGNQTPACLELQITTSSCVAHIYAVWSKDWECGQGLGGRVVEVQSRCCPGVCGSAAPKAQEKDVKS